MNPSQILPSPTRSIFFRQCVSKLYIRVAFLRARTHLLDMMQGLFCQKPHSFQSSFFRNSLTKDNLGPFHQLHGLCSEDMGLVRVPCGSSGALYRQVFTQRWYFISLRYANDNIVELLNRLSRRLRWRINYFGISINGRDGVAQLEKEFCWLSPRILPSNLTWQRHCSPNCSYETF